MCVCGGGEPFNTAVLEFSITVASICLLISCAKIILRLILFKWAQQYQTAAWRNTQYLSRFMLKTDTQTDRQIWVGPCDLSVEDEEGQAWTEARQNCRGIKSPATASGFSQQWLRLSEE